VRPDKTPYCVQWTDRALKDAKKGGLSKGAQAQIQVQVEKLRDWTDPEIRKSDGYQAT
jgi:mRNA-degrading endonuclease RelE of RelBE toxin-antitoxin system